MKRIAAALFIVPFIFSSLIAQSSATLEFSTAFPLQIYQTGVRDYYMTTKYSVGIAVPASWYADIVGSISYTQHNALFVQEHSFIDRTGALSNAGGFFRIPFTNEPYFSEYGFFGGVRMKSGGDIIHAFVRGEIGMLATKYGTIQYVAIDNGELFQPSYRPIEGTVYKVQVGILYGAGLSWKPFSSFSINADLHAINRLNREPLDVYRGIGVQIGI